MHNHGHYGGEQAHHRPEGNQEGGEGRYGGTFFSPSKISMKLKPLFFCRDFFTYFCFNLNLNRKKKGKRKNTAKLQGG